MYSHKLSSYFKAFKPLYQLRNLFFRKHSEVEFQNFRNFSVSNSISYAGNSAGIYNKQRLEWNMPAVRDESKIRKWHKNWKSFVTTEVASFVHNTDTGIRNIVLKLNNKTSEMIDYVQIRVLYMQEDGKMYKSEYSEVFGVKPGSLTDLTVYDSPKGCSLKVYITHIVASALNLDVCQDLYE